MPRAVVCKTYGPPSGLTIEERPQPQPAAGEVVIKIHCASVLFVDTLIIQDKYQMHAKTPFVPGGEAAGVIVETGTGVQGLKVGDHVSFSNGLSGGWAEYACIPAVMTQLIPKGVELVSSLGLGYAYGTALYGLEDRGKLRQGETVLVLGAGGYLGIAAIQVAKLFGATVIAAASTKEKLDLCRANGADHCINYEEGNLRDELKKITRGNGVDVVFDNVGGKHAEPSVRAMAWGGRYLVIGFTGGIPKVAFNLFLVKGISVVGVFTGGMFQATPAMGKELGKRVMKLLLEGKIHPPKPQVYNLADAPKALEDFAARKTVGRAVLTTEAFHLASKL